MIDKKYDEPTYLQNMDKWFRAANYLSVAQIYLRNNPLLRTKLKKDDIKLYPIGHWGTIPGQNFAYVHLNRVINKYNLNMFYIEGPGHGGQVMISNSYLDGSYSEIYPEIPMSEEGIKKLCKRFSFPGGSASHAAPETPGSIHEGGELGYSLSHALGAILDNPDVIAATVIGDGDNPKKMHALMAKKLDLAIEKILSIQKEARKKPANEALMPKWPMIVLRTPKGWTCPKTWNGEAIQGSFRAHQVPIPVSALDPKYIKELEKWLKSYKPQELFDLSGKPIKDILELAPKGAKRMGKNPITNGGINPKPLALDDWTKFALDIKNPGEIKAQDMVELGKYLASLISLNPHNFRIFGPDETKSNRLNAIFKVTNRQWLEPISAKYDEWMSPEGRVIDSQLSEHQVEGFLEGYVLTGRHGIFASYEAFLRVIDSMLTQHMKWLKKASELKWRKPYPSLNVIATSTSFQQDHNGYTHQDPGLLGHLADKRPELIREYLPADTNTLLAVMNKAFTEKNVINLIVASKQPRDQFYNINEAKELVEKGYKIINWASNVKDNDEPDLVMVASGVEPNLESLAAISYLHNAFPNLKIRYVYVLDLLRLKSPSLDPRGISDEEFDKVFTKDKPIVFAFHGYEGLIRDILFPRKNHNLIVHGYRENGDITTSFDIRFLSEMDRFHIAYDAAKAVYQDKANEFLKTLKQKMSTHTAYVREYGYDMSEIINWKWKNIN